MERAVNAPTMAAVPPAENAAGNPRREVIINLLVTVAAPLAVFYGLRAWGVDQWLALLLGALPPAVQTVRTVFTKRRLDGFALFALSVLVLSVAVSFLTGSPRFLLAKDGWMTALAGLWILLTLLRTPFYYQAIRSLTGGAVRGRAETAWSDSPVFRHTMRMATSTWGVGLVVDAGVRVALAYTLPVDQVPLVSGLQYAVLFISLELSTQIYLRRSLVRAGIRLDDDKNSKPEVSA